MDPEIKTLSDTDSTDLNENSISFTYSELDLNKDSKESEEIEFLIEKYPILMQKGNVYGSPSGILIDDSPQTNLLLEKARELRSIPEKQRLYEIMNIVKQNINYAYPSAIEELHNHNPVLGNWVEENINEGKEVKLSEVLDKGYGVCRHLSVLYLYLAQEAGLEGIMLRSDGSHLVNIVRTDNGQPLFRSVDIGQNPLPHTWVEIRDSYGRWIPIDPSTNLVGDTEEGLDMFKTANYMAVATTGLEAETEPKESLYGSFRLSYFKPGESSTLGKAFISISEPWNWTTNINTYCSYKGDAKLVISQDPNYKDSAFRVKKCI